jgi:hypothetical protein
MAPRDAILPQGASFLEQTMVRGGSEIVRCVYFRVNDGGPRWRGAVESRRRTCAEMRVQGGGTV